MSSPIAAYSETFWSLFERYNAVFNGEQDIESKKPHDAKWSSSRQLFLSHPLAIDGFLYDRNKLLVLKSLNNCRPNGPLSEKTRLHC